MKKWWLFVLITLIFLSVGGYYYIQELKIKQEQKENERIIQQKQAKIEELRRKYAEIRRYHERVLLQLKNQFDSLESFTERKRSEKDGLPESKQQTFASMD